MCKYVESQYENNSNSLGLLHSDIIDYFGTFLSKKESISLGHLNKQLYIETQKQSYLLRRNTDVTNINACSGDLLLLHESNPFSYSMPTNLIINFNKKSKYFGGSFSMCKMFSSQWFNNLFYRVNTFRCRGSIESLPYIPIELLFNNSNKYRNKRRKNMFDRFEISLSNNCYLIETTNTIATTIDQFCQNVNTYFSRYNHNTSIWENDNIRTIRHLEINTDLGLASARKISLLFAPLSHRIDISIDISTIQDLKRIFHKNLKHLVISKSAFVINPFLQPEKESKTNENYDLVPQLKIISIYIDLKNIRRFEAIVAKLDAFNLRKNAVTCKILLDGPIHEGVNINSIHNHDHIMSPILASFLNNKVINNQNCKTQHIEFYIEDDQVLSCCASIFIYLNSHKDKLSNIRKIRIK